MERWAASWAGVGVWGLALGASSVNGCSLCHVIVWLHQGCVSTPPMQSLHRCTSRMVCPLSRSSRQGRQPVTLVWHSRQPCSFLPQPTCLPLHCTHQPTLPTLPQATWPPGHLPTCQPVHAPAHRATLQIMSIKASHSGRLTDYKSDTCTYMEGWARAWHSLVVAVGGGGRLVQG